MRTLLLLAAALLAGPAGAQAGAPLLTPGHPDLAADALTFEDQAFAVRVGDRTVGQVTQEVTEGGGAVTVVTAIDIPQFRQSGTDSARVRTATLAPEFFAATQGDGPPQTLSFDGAAVTGSYRARGHTLPIDLELATPAFHDGSTSVAGGAALVARALPFREGYAGTVRTFHPTRRLEEVTLAVAGRERAERLDGTEVSAWVVEERPEGADEPQRRYYVDPETRALLQVVTEQSSGPPVVVRQVDPEALAAEAAARDAVPRLVPGDAALDVGRLASGETAATLRLLQPMQQDVGTQTQRVTVDREAGTVTVVTRVEIPMQNLTLVDSAVAALPSLAAVAQSLDGGGADVSVAFADGSVTGTSNGEEVDVALDVPLFAASLLPQVLQALPLEAGYQRVLPTFAVGGVLFPFNGVTPVYVEVSGPEPEGDRTAWAVVATPDGAPPTTYYVDVETREVLRTRLQPQSGVVIDVVPEE
jgi:hypothetical protein